MAKQIWTVKGRVVLTHLIPEVTDIEGSSTTGVRGITVDVQAREKIPFGWGWWNSWAKVTANSDGHFTVSKEKDSDRRQFRVKILFDNDDLRVKEGQQTGISIGGDGFPIDIDIDLTDKDWYVIHDDREKSEAEDGRRAGTHDLGDIKILATRARQLGDIWVLVTDAIADLAVMGPEWGFKKKLVVKYPMGFGNSIDSFDSYSNPINGSVYIKEDQLFARTILHEVFHQWVYGRTTGEDGMAWQLVKHQDIHGKREFTTFVPFHEALADWAAYRLLDRMTGGARQTFHEDNSDFHPDTPYSRDHLGKAFDNDSERLLANVDYTERGWTSFFKLLTYPKLYELDLNGQDTYATDDYQPGPRSPRPTADLSFPRVLKVFNTDVTIPESAHKLANADLTFERLMPRAQAVCPAMTDDVVEAILLCLDPNATRNPGADLFNMPTHDVEHGWPQRR